MAAAAVSSSLLPFSHLTNSHPRFLSHAVTLSRMPRSSPPRAAPPDSPDGEKATGSGPSAVDEVRYKRKKRRRKDVIRREPIQIAAGRAQQEGEKKEEPSANEGAFLLAWLGLGALILVEGVALAASGFLPEEWDDFFVKFLYPSFTPTVFLFVGLSVAYGVTKYFEGEKMKKN